MLSHKRCPRPHAGISHSWQVTTPAWESRTTAGSHTTLWLPSSVQCREALSCHLQPWPAGPTAQPAPQHGQLAAGMGKCCTCKQTQPQGQRAAAGPVLQHRNGTSCSSCYTGRASLQGLILGHGMPVTEMPCDLSSVAARAQQQSDADTKPSWLL